MARRKKVESLPPGFTPVKHHLKFGWCSTGHHEQCRKSYIDWNQVLQECVCNCHCHKEN